MGRAGRRRHGGNFRPGSAMTRSGITDDSLLGGRVRLLQPAKGHRVGTDAVLLSGVARATRGEAVIDVGAATGAVGLMIAARQPDLDLTLVERDPDLAALCRQNLELNGTTGRAVVADILDARSRRDAGLKAQTADLVVTNPPFLEEGRARLSADANRAAAHALPSGGLEQWLQACAWLLKPNGRLALIHRADRLADCLAALEGGFGAVRLRLVHPRADQAAVRLLLVASKGRRTPLTIEPPLVLHDASGRFTPETEALHRGEAAL
jgi:tRNA1(Val) A37 N6-methylase TrmN6